MLHLTGPPIPIARVARIALNLVQHRMNPCRRRIAFVLLDHLMRRVPIIRQRQFNGPEQFIAQISHKKLIYPAITAPAAAASAFTRTVSGKSDGASTV